MFNLFKVIFKYKQSNSPDKLGLYPETVHIRAIPERRYLWSSRLLVIFASLSICFNIFLVLTLYLMLPQKTSAPRLLRQDTDIEQLTIISKNENQITPNDLLSEKFIREYITDRHSISNNLKLQKKKWQEGSRFFWKSSEQVYQNFMTSDIDAILNLSQGSDFVRKVNIEKIHLIARGFWLVRFATLDFYSHADLPVINIWNAHIRAAMMLVDYNNISLRYNNPHGFNVLEYSLSYVGTPINVEEYLIKNEKNLLSQLN